MGNTDEFDKLQVIQQNLYYLRFFLAAVCMQDQ